MNCVPPKGVFINFRPANVTLFGNRVFADVIKLRRGHQVGPNPITGDLTRRENRDQWTQGEGPVKIEPGSGVMLTQTKEHQGLWHHEQLGTGKERVFQRAFGGSVTVHSPWFQASGVQNCERTTLCCFVVLCQQSSGTSTGNQDRRQGSPSQAALAPGDKQGLCVPPGDSDSLRGDQGRLLEKVASPLRPGMGMRRGEVQFGNCPGVGPCGCPRGHIQ